MVQYTFVSRWHLQAPLQAVWDAIYLSKLWPEWWPDIKSVVETEPGDERGIGSVRIYKMQTALPYSLTFAIRLLKREEFQLLSSDVSKDLQGCGSWVFKEINSSTVVECHWQVATTRRWMNMFTFLLRPAFVYNHKIIMRRGAVFLAKKLNAQLISAT